MPFFSLPHLRYANFLLLVIEDKTNILDHKCLLAGDGFWEIDLSTWDVAAGGLIVSEAGGMVSDFDEKINWWLTGNIVATNPKIYDPLIKIIQQISLIFLT